MSAGDLQATITGRDQGASAAIDQSTKAMERLERQTKKANKEAADLQKKVGKNYKEGGAAVAKAGGPVGSLGGRLLGGAGMDGPLARVAVGFGLASLAIQALGAVAAISTKRVQSLIDSENKLSDARDKGEKTVDAQARAGHAQDADVRGVIARGGKPIEDLIRQMEGEGMGSTAQIAKAIGILQKAGKSGDLGAGVKNTLMDLSRVGIPVDQAAQSLADGHLPSDPGEVRRKGMRIFARDRGITGNVAEEFQSELATVADSGFLSESLKMSKRDGQMSGLNRDATADRGSDAATRDFIDAKNPVIAAQLESYKVQAKQLEVLNRLAAAQANFLTKAWEKVTGKTGTAAGADAARLSGAMAGAVTQPEQ